MKLPNNLFNFSKNHKEVDQSEYWHNITQGMCTDKNEFHNIKETNKKTDSKWDSRTEDDDGLSEMKLDMSEETSTVDIEELELEKREELATARCIVCGVTGIHHKVISHANTHHKHFKGSKVELVHRTFHTCKLCNKKLLFTKSSVRLHLR